MARIGIDKCIFIIISLSLSLSILLDLEHNMNIYETIKEMMGKEEITLEAGGWRGTILTD
jgi:hypothetical protein